MMEVQPIFGRYCAVQGTRIFYDEVGGPGPTIVCLHPAGSDSRMFAGLLPLLAETGYHVVAPDLPGHCRSHAVGNEPLRSIEAMADFANEFIATVCRGRRPVLLGTSMGGLVALRLLVDHPDSCRALIGLEVAGWTAPTFPPSGDAERPAWAPSWADSLERAAMSAVGRSASAQQREELRWLHRSASQRVAAPALAGWAGFDLRGQLSAIPCPVLLVKGADDIWLPTALVRQTAAEIGDHCAVEIVEGVGHYPAFEDPRRIAALAVDFLARVGVGP